MLHAILPRFFTAIFAVFTAIIPHFLQFLPRFYAITGELVVVIFHIWHHLSSYRLKVVTRRMTTISWFSRGLRDVTCWDSQSPSLDLSSTAWILNLLSVGDFNPIQFVESIINGIIHCKKNGSWRLCPQTQLSNLSKSDNVNSILF